MIRSLAVLALVSSSLLSQTHNVGVACCQFTDSVSGTSVTTISAGTTVQWNFSGSVPHTVTNGTGAADPVAGTVFDVPLSGSNPTFAHTFNAPGTFPYFCRPHETFGMTGTVIVTVPASVVSVGAGCAGSSGVTLLAGTNGLPQLGNASFAITLAGGPANGQALMFLAATTSPTPIPLTPICSLHLDLTSLLFFMGIGLSPIGPFPLDGSGALTLPLPLGSSPGLMGAAIALQFAVPDAGAPGGVVTSNALGLVIGN